MHCGPQLMQLSANQQGNVIVRVMPSSVHQRTCVYTLGIHPRKFRCSLVAGYTKLPVNLNCTG
jgi:hypothetical protein